MKRFCLVVGMFLLVSVLGYARTGEKVLLIFSYHPEYSWVVEETRGAEDTLRNRGVEIEKFYLDTKRRTSIE